MKILFGHSKWSMWDDPLEDFLARAVADQFDVVEIGVIPNGTVTMHAKSSRVRLKSTAWA